jgi:hypothetical protein
MNPLSALLDNLRADAGAWSSLAAVDLLFAHRTEAAAILLAALGLALGVLTWRVAVGRSLGRNLVALPALLGVRSRFPAMRHAPMLLVIRGFPLFAVALADPLLAVVAREISYPGRRIAILLDASSSMMVPFTTVEVGAPRNDATFLTTVAAAETFVRQRKSGHYRDLLSLIEFGDEAYVITPFTSDYDNVLLGISLIGDWGEYMRFPDGGTAIGRAIDQATQLFAAFRFLDAAGNAMVIFSDGQDSQVVSKGKALAEILASAANARIPVYLVRTSRGKAEGDVVPDAIWRPAVEATGGRFYAASSEADVLRAISEIDRQSAGTIAVRTYAVRQPRFAVFALMAAALWAAALTLKLAVRDFTVFP